MRILCRVKINVLPLLKKEYELSPGGPFGERSLHFLGTVAIEDPPESGPLGKWAIHLHRTVTISSVLPGGPFGERPCILIKEDAG
jgi:hypothetical protein